MEIYVGVRGGGVRWWWAYLMEMELTYFESHTTERTQQFMCIAM